ncbi:MAG TPA: HEAT repeat domain-containing protein, partial [Polyangiaceae bacterium]
DPFSYDARIALARLGDARAKSAILRGLGAWSFDARTLAVAAVGRARLREARDVLIAWMESPERADPTAVREALARLDAEPRS